MLHCPRCLRKDRRKWHHKRRQIRTTKKRRWTMNEKQLRGWEEKEKKEHTVKNDYQPTSTRLLPTPILLQPPLQLPVLSMPHLTWRQTQITLLLVFEKKTILYNGEKEELCDKIEEVWDKAIMLVSEVKWRARVHSSCSGVPWHIRQNLRTMLKIKTISGRSRNWTSIQCGNE